MKNRFIFFMISFGLIMVLNACGSQKTEIASAPIEVSEDFGGIVLSVSIDSDRYKPGESFVVRTSVVNNTDEDIYLHKEEDECERYASLCTHTEMYTTIRKSETVSLVDKKVFDMAGKVPAFTFHKLEKGESLTREIEFVAANVKSSDKYDSSTILGKNVFSNEVMVPAEEGEYTGKCSIRVRDGESDNVTEHYVSFSITVEK